MVLIYSFLKQYSGSGLDVGSAVRIVYKTPEDTSKSVIGLKLSRLESDMYVLDLDFNCFNLSDELDCNNLKIFGGLVYNDVEDYKDLCHVGFGITLDDVKNNFEQKNWHMFIETFERHLVDIMNNKSNDLCVDYYFVLSDGLDFKCDDVSYFKIKYNTGANTNSVKVEMRINDIFSTILKKSGFIDVLLEKYTSDVYLEEL